MVAGASTHIKWILENGIFSEQRNVPFYSTIFWDSLAFLDLIAAALLLIRPKHGILLTLSIIITDVVHNNLIVFLYNQHIDKIGFTMWATKYWMLVAQILFMAFVVFTSKRNLKEVTVKSKSIYDTNEI